MSDGSSEIARDQERAEAMEDWLLALLVAFCIRDYETIQEARAAAILVDGVRGGYWSHPTGGWALRMTQEADDLIFDKDAAARQDFIERLTKGLQNVWLKRALIAAWSNEPPTA